MASVPRHSSELANPTSERPGWNTMCSTRPPPKSCSWRSSRNLEPRHLPNCHRSVAVDPLMCLKVPPSNRGRGVVGMLQKYVSKFAMDILPSVAATIIGAYIVNHYIANKPAAQAPVAAVAPPVESKKADPRNDAKASAPSADLAYIPEPGIKAKGISEKAMMEKTAAEKPAAVEKPAVAEKPADRSAEKPAETASIPVETRRRPSLPLREKAT